jgi:hypothetical protein
MLATIVDWGALGQVVIYSFAAALVLTFLFTTGVLSLEVEGRRASTAYRAAGAVSFALCVALVALGLYVMFTTK